MDKKNTKDSFKDEQDEVEFINVGNYYYDDYNMIKYYNIKTIIQY